MIYDKLERLTMYKGLNPNLDTLIDHVLNLDVNALHAGKNEVDGDKCWLLNNGAKLAPERAKYERHKEYIDLQIPIDEGEIIVVKPMEDLDWPPFDTETGFTDGPDGIPLDMMPGTFAIFFPGDAHGCGLSKAGQTEVRKLVGKAKMA